MRADPITAETSADAICWSALRRGSGPQPLSCLTILTREAIRPGRQMPTICLWVGSQSSGSRLDSLSAEVGPW
jgi:hypothetical protein